MKNLTKMALIGAAALLGVPAFADGMPACGDFVKMYEAQIAICTEADGQRYVYPADLWSSNPAKESLIRKLNAGFLPPDGEKLKKGALYATKRLS